jgi:hypothetical protein
MIQIQRLPRFNKAAKGWATRSRYELKYWCKCINLIYDLQDLRLALSSL